MRLAVGLCCLVLPAPAAAHVSEGALVLLLPTGHYIAAGVATVAATVLLVAWLPAARVRGLFRTRAIGPPRRRLRWPVAGLFGAAALVWGVADGWAGPQDPTRNALPLLLWTFVWLILLPGQAVWGDLWRHANPWVLPWWLMRRSLGRGRGHDLAPRRRGPDTAQAPAPSGVGGGPSDRLLLRLPPRAAGWIGAVLLLAFAGFALADPAPAQPRRLAVLAALWWGVHMAGVMMFGPRWLWRVEPITVSMRLYASLAPVARGAGGMRIGLPGWQWRSRARPAAPLVAAILGLLALGSFDGVSETFWWYAQLGLNPLAPPGRSALVGAALLGFVATLGVLTAVYVASLWLGTRLAGASAIGAATGTMTGPVIGASTGASAIAPGTAAVVCALAPGLLPIAWAYHVSHFLTVTLVEGQSLLHLLADPARRSQPHVTTGFLAAAGPVHLLWLTQAALVVGGHLLAVLMTERAMLRLYDGRRAATRAQAPFAAAMVLFTLFGLWLLAAPRVV